MTNKVDLLYPTVVQHFNPKFNMFQHSTENYLGFFFIWMRIIGIYPLIEHDSKVLKQVGLIIRYGLWILFLVANVAIVVLFYKSDYRENSVTMYWSFVIDVIWNWTIHRLGIHSWIVLIALGRNRWFKLHKSLIKIDKIVEHSIGYGLITFARLKKFIIAAILYILLSVKT